MEDISVGWIITSTIVALVTLIAWLTRSALSRHLTDYREQTKKVDDMNTKVIQHDENCSQYARRFEKIDEALRITASRPELDKSINSVRAEMEKTVIKIENDSNHIKNDMRQLRNTIENASKGLDHHFKLVEASLAALAKERR